MIDLFNNINISDENNMCLEKSCEVIQNLINECEQLNEEVYGFKYISNEQKQHLEKSYERINELKQTIDKLNNRLINNEKKTGGFNNNFINMIKKYSRNITEERKKEIENKYSKYLNIKDI